MGNQKIKTKESFDLTSIEGRNKYFEYKVGKEIKKIKEYLEGRTFIAYLLGPKSSGKGTYAKMFKETIGSEKIEHFSVGDMIRELDSVVGDEEKIKELVGFLEKNYRGFFPLEEIINSLKTRSTKILLPTELILALIKREISKKGRKALFIDGFPRNLDQISYSLFFRDLIDYREDPDIFVLIDVPHSVIDERIKYRVICPLCQTSRNLKLLATKKVGYDKKENKFFLVCDNPSCKGERMVTKEGDELGIEPIRERLNTDKDLVKKALSLHGIPKIMLNNSVPVNEVDNFENYEITPEFVYKIDKKTKTIKTTEKPWKVLDDDGNPCYSLMPPPVVVSLIKQMSDILENI